jgi:hypothetical protein
VEGIVSEHPEYEDGSTISTSPPTNDIGNGKQDILMETSTGSQYLLRNPAGSSSSRTGFSFFPTPSTDTTMNVAGDMVESSSSSSSSSTSSSSDGGVDGKMDETKRLMQQVKDAGVAGVLSYALWELGFWTVSVPVCVGAYHQVTGHWPDLTNADDVKQLGAEAFAFVNVARFAVPLRIGLALSTTPWIQRNVVDRVTSRQHNATNNE